MLRLALCINRALALVARQRCRALELGARLGQAAELREQVAAHGGQQVIRLRAPRSATSASTIASASAGPNAIETATARFSCTTGDGASAASAS